MPRAGATGQLRTFSEVCWKKEFSSPPVSSFATVSAASFCCLAFFVASRILLCTSSGLIPWFVCRCFCSSLTPSRMSCAAAAPSSVLHGYLLVRSLSRRATAEKCKISTCKILKSFNKISQKHEIHGTEYI